MSREWVYTLDAVKVLLQASRFASQHSQAALVTVIATSGSTPRHAGAKMLVAADGSQVGTIGGGQIELELTRVACEVARNGRSRLVKRNLVQDLAMCCGGSMELFVEELAPNLTAISEVLSRQSDRERSVLVTDLAGGKKSVSSVDTSMSYPARDVTAFREVICPAPRMVLFGCGHLSAALGPLAKALDFDVVICDDNETAAIDECPAWADRWVSSFNLKDIESQVGTLGQGDYLLIVTRDHGIDQRILESALPRLSEFKYLGLIGSMGKIGRFRKRILSKTIVSEEEWQKLHAPLGLSICAETPQEIAVSIMAELVLVKNRGKE